jgi:hypothetical protein
VAGTEVREVVDDQTVGDVGEALARGQWKELTEQLALTLLCEVQ